MSNMNIPETCWDCPFYKDSGYGYHLCSLTSNRKPYECPLIEIEQKAIIEKPENCWWWNCPCYDHNNYTCGIRDFDDEYKNTYNIPNWCSRFYMRI